MTDFKVSRSSRTALVLGAGLTLAVAGCSSGTSNSEESSSPTSASSSTSPTSTSSPSSTISPPSGSSEVASAKVGDATYDSFKTSQTPKEVVSFYNTELSSNGFKVTQTGGGGGGWGGYGGSSAGVSGNNGSTFVAVHAGGQSGATTYFEVCTGSSAQSVKNCQNSNHSSSKQS